MTGIFIMAALALLFGFLVVWWFFRQRPTGLFRSILLSYFESRQHGQSIDQALRWMVVSHSLAEEKQAKALDLISQIPARDSEDQRVIEAVLIVCYAEWDVLPSRELREKSRRQIAAAYRRLIGQPANGTTSS